MEALPRDQVAKFLEKTDANAAVGYLEHVVHALGEKGADFHDKLAELYLARARAAKDSGGHESLVGQLSAKSGAEISYRRHRGGVRPFHRFPGVFDALSAVPVAQSLTGRR